MAIMIRTYEVRKNQFFFNPRKYYFAVRMEQVKSLNCTIRRIYVQLTWRNGKGGERCEGTESTLESVGATFQYITKPYHFATCFLSFKLIYISHIDAFFSILSLSIPSSVK